MSENDINSQEALRQPNRESGRVPENLIMPDGEAIFESAKKQRIVKLPRIDKVDAFRGQWPG